MENNIRIFRQEAIRNRLHHSLGTIRINVPLNFRVAGYFALGIIVLLMLFFHTAKVAESISVRGYLDAEKGILSIESNFSGIVKKINVDEGDVVHKGQLLLTVSNPRTVAINIQIKNLKQQIKNLRREYQLKAEHYQALKKLHEKKYVSTINLKESESTMLELQSKLKEAEYNFLKVKDNQIQYIKAPIPGTITNIMYRQGQRVPSAKVILQLIPKETNLIARLYIPAREIGFLTVGQTLYLKYDAYPSQRFGFYEATINEINQTILTDEKEDKPVRIGEPYYKVKAILKNNHVSLYGKQVPLNHGMTLTAIASGEKKSISQWILDPIYSCYGEYVL